MSPRNVSGVSIERISGGRGAQSALLANNGCKRLELDETEAKMAYGYAPCSSAAFVYAIGRNMRFFTAKVLAGLAALAISSSSVYPQTRGTEGSEPSTEDGSTIDIAVVSPLTTSSNSFGIPLLQSTTLAVDLYNSNNVDWKNTHRAQNWKIKLHIFDDQSDGQVAADTLDEIEKSKAVAVLGPANSSVAITLEEKLKIQNSDLVVVTPLATATDLTDKGHFWSRFFRANVPDQIRLSKLVNDIFDTSPSTRNLILVYEQEDAYGVGMLRDTKTLLASVPGFSMSRVSTIGFSRNLQNSEAERIADDINNTGNGLANDAVLLLGITRDAIKIINALNKKEISSQIYFNEPDETEFKTASDQNTDLKNVKIVSVYYSESPIVGNFVKCFQLRFDQVPSKAAAVSFDAANMLLKSIDMALDEGRSPAKNFGEFRKRIGEILASNGASDMDFVVPGQHQFINGEFHHLQFFRLSYDKDGNLIPVPLPNEPPSYIKPIPSINVFFSSFWPLLAVAACIFISSCLGSTLRQYYANPGRSLRLSIISLTSLIIDPIIAVLMSVAALTALFIFKPDIFELMKGSFVISLSMASVFGALVGYLGIKAFGAITGMLGVKGAEKPEEA